MTVEWALTIVLFTDPGFVGQASQPFASRADCITGAQAWVSQTAFMHGVAMCIPDNAEHRRGVLNPAGSIIMTFGGGKILSQKVKP